LLRVRPQRVLGGERSPLPYSADGASAAEGGRGDRRRGTENHPLPAQSPSPKLDPSLLGPRLWAVLRVKCSSCVVSAGGHPPTPEITFRSRARRLSCCRNVAARALGPSSCQMLVLRGVRRRTPAYFGNHLPLPGLKAWLQALGPSSCQMLVLRGVRRRTPAYFENRPLSAGAGVRIFGHRSIRYQQRTGRSLTTAPRPNNRPEQQSAT